MHDPMTVAFEIRRPWPRVKPLAEVGNRKRWSLPFVRAFGREFYFPALIVVWHVDPEKGGDDDSCRHAARKKWWASGPGKGFERSFWVYTLHVHHWRVQIVPLQAFRRWLLTRCAGCDKRFPYGYAPVGYSWDTPRRSFWQKWTQGEQGLYHFPEHSPFPDGRPCSLMYEHKNYLRWRESYPDLIGGEFDRGDPVDRWLDDKSMAEALRGYGSRGAENTGLLKARALSSEDASPTEEREPSAP